MQNEFLAGALRRASSRELSVVELIQAVETVRPISGEGAARRLYETWIEHNGDNPLLYAVLFNFSVMLTDGGDLDAARATLERAVAQKSDFMPAHINLGRIHERQGKPALAATEWSRVVDGLPQIAGPAIAHKITALNQLARVLESGNQDDAAENMLRLSVEIDPAQREPVQHLVALRQRQCEWPIVAPWERVSRTALMKGMSPLSAAAFTDDPLLQLANAWNYNREDVGTPDAAAFPDTAAARAQDGPLRIGYLSSDLREHAVGHLMAEVFALHDRKKVEVFAYYCGIKTDDPLHRKFKADADRWIDVSAMGDAEAVARIAADGIQILVDLNGYTREGRTKLVALRPAPVIVNWLGYPGTMGSSYHHYIVADAAIIPPELEIYYSEKVLRLPCYQPTNRARIVSQRVPTRAEAGLPENETVFCCFNGAHKITRFTFERWLKILAQVPGSVLWLLSSAENIHQRLRDFAAGRGIAPERLVFAGKMPNPDHLARYPLADLFLDCVPYGAHTTASDAMWMGVPVLTLAGRSFASRVCGSLVRAAGVPELVCTRPEEFIARAVELGVRREKLKEFRERLIAGRDSCTLFDTPKLVRSLEALYADMWRDAKAGKLPQPDLTNLDACLEIGILHDHEQEDVLAIEDYEGWWREKLARRHRVRPLAPDGRLFKP